MLFYKTEKVILKFIWQYKESRIRKAIFKKNKSGEMTLPDKTYHSGLSTNKQIIVTTDRKHPNNFLQKCQDNLKQRGVLSTNKLEQLEN
jgi:hypothetical protein